MSWLHDFRWLSAFALFVALPAVSQNRFAAASEPLSGENSAAETATADVPQNLPITAPLPNLSHEQMGDIYEVRQRYQAAIAAYSKVEHPSAALWIKMGIAYQMLYDLKDAGRCFKEALRIEPQNASALNNLGTVHDSMKNFGRAELLYRKALKLEPHSATIFKNLGTNLLMQHRYDAGQEAYQQALSLDSHIFDKDRFGPQVNDPAPKQERGTANYFKARSCAAAGMNECAIAYLRKAFGEGAATLKKVAEDASFESLRGTPALEQLLALEQ